MFDPQLVLCNVRYVCAGAEREGRAREGASGAGTGDTCLATVVCCLVGAHGWYAEGLTTGSLAACMRANVQKISASGGIFNFG